MGKLLLFVISATLIVGGIYVLWAGVLLTDRIHFPVAIVGIVLATGGVYFLWTYFISPLFGIKREG
jgi:hypothetical protein